MPFAVATVRSIVRATYAWARACALPVTALALVGAAACNSGVQPDPAAEAIAERQRTTPPSRLFFLNTRAASYAQEAHTAEGRDVYRARRFRKTRDVPVLLTPAIVDAWVDGAAYLVLELEDEGGRMTAADSRIRLGDAAELAAWPARAGEPSSTWRSRSSVARGHDALAQRIAAVLRAGGTVTLVGEDGTETALLRRPEQRAAFLATLRDYDRLVERA